MQEIFLFFKDIFALKDTRSCKIGLCQFKSEEVKPAKMVLKVAKNVKISDLMKKSNV